MASELEVGKIVAKTPATTGTSPLEVARLEVKDEGVNMAVGMGPKLSFYTPHNDASFEGASIAAKKENQSDTNEATSLTFSTCPDAGTNTERLTIASDGNIEQHTDSNGIVKFGVKNESTGTSARAMVNVLSDSGNLDLSMNGSNYTGVAGWADSGTISTGSGASGGLKINAVVGGLALQTNQTTRLSIANSTGLATFSGGIAFQSATTGSGTGTGYTLDSYEEGTWTPTYAPSSGSYTSLTMSVTSAKYTRVGDVCYVQAYIETDGTVNTSGGSGNLQISGLPFTSATGYGASFAVGYAANWGSNDVPLGGYVETGLAKITLSARSSVNGQQVSINFNNLDTGTDKNRLLFSGSYKVA